MPTGSRIGLNILYLVPGETGGMETYARRLIPALAVARLDLAFVALVNRDAFGLLGDRPFGDRVEVIEAPTGGRNRLARVAFEQLRLPRLLERQRIELLHSLGSAAPARAGVPSVVTIHDVIYARHPEAHTAVMRAGMRVLVPLAARGADRIIAGSHAAADEVAQTLRVPRDRIDVVYHGGRPPGRATPERELRRRLDLPDAPLILSVSARRPHKNLDRLLEAIAGMTSEPRPALVIPGYPTAFEDRLRSRIEALGIADRVRVLGWVPDADLEGLYGVADCFAFPSLAEGFGLPVLEAMERGVAVACSRAPPLPEVAGDAARYFDPLSVGDMRAAIEELLGDEHLRSRLEAAGRERAKLFSWSRAARETLEVYERASPELAKPDGRIADRRA